MEMTSNLRTPAMTHTSTIPILSGRLGAPCRASQSPRIMHRGVPGHTMERQDFDAQYVSRLTEGRRFRRAPLYCLLRRILTDQAPPARLDHSGN